MKNMSIKTITTTVVCLGLIVALGAQVAEAAAGNAKSRARLDRARNAYATMDRSTRVASPEVYAVPFMTRDGNEAMSAPAGR